MTNFREHVFPFVFNALFSDLISLLEPDKCFLWLYKKKTTVKKRDRENVEDSLNRLRDGYLR